MNTDKIYTSLTCIPATKVHMVQQFNSSEEIDDEMDCLFRQMCKAQSKTECNHAYTSGCAENIVFPVWVLDDTYIVHPDDIELCKRVFRPEYEPDYMKELVHELRYNANLPGMIPTAMRKVEQEFNKKRKT